MELSQKEKALEKIKHFFFDVFFHGGENINFSSF